MASEGDDRGPATCPTDLFIVGAGVQIPDQLTMAAVRALNESNEVYTILPRSCFELLPSSWLPKLRDLRALYLRGGRRIDVYTAEVELIFQAARSNPPVAYLTVGNPVVFDSVTSALIARSAEHEMRIRVIAGVSSVDAIMADLGMDYAPGLQVYDATSLVVHDIRPRTDVACLLMQPDVFGTGYVAMGWEPRASALRPLREHLLRSYPENHQVTYVTCSSAGGVAPDLESFPLRELGGSENLPQKPGASLLIPSSTALSVNAELHERALDQEEFVKNFRLSRPIEGETLRRS